MKPKIAVKEGFIKKWENVSSVLIIFTTLEPCASGKFPSFLISPSLNVRIEGGNQICQLFFERLC